MTTTTEAVPTPLEQLSAQDREMINAVIDAHYEHHGSAVKGDLHGSLYAAGRMSLQATNAELVAKLAASEKLSDAISRDCNNTALERNTLRTQLQKAEQERDGARGQHSELLFAVATKFPGESRHQTALRYITNAENQTAYTSQEKTTKP